MPGANHTNRQTTCQTLHIRCGSDIYLQLKQTGLLEHADFLEFADPFCLGPIDQSSIDFENLQPWIETRSQFIADAFELPLPGVMEKQQQAYQQLLTATDYSQIVLWFEHDSYDQLILAYLLCYFAKQSLAKNQLQLICINQHGEVEKSQSRFMGLGQLSAAQLKALWDNQKTAVISQQLAAGKQVWHTLAGNNLQQLQQLAASEISALPFMSNALQRHFLEQNDPETNQPSLTEQITLEILAEQSPIEFQELFQAYTEKEPLPWLGDLMYWYLLKGMGNENLIRVEAPQPEQGVSTKYRTNQA